ncbi:MAG: thioredoxin [Bacteroidales bacterium]|nr:thioredoxin [Bacteroidales bacterium]
MEDRIMQLRDYHSEKVVPDARNFVRACRRYATVFIFALLVAVGGNNAAAQTDNTSANKPAKTKTEKKQDKEKLEIITLTQEEFVKKIFDYNDTTMIYKGKKPAIVDFYADWCGPCKRLSPILDQLLKEYDGAFIVYKVNVDHNKDLARALQVYNIPTLLYLVPKQKPKRSMGLLTKEQLKEIIDKYLVGTEK